ncbi:MAG: heavy-metal-associated domain-containing protein [Actinobacteria bacterium]|nr:heavy-metal-associated domain-containing protein [Actinomycetota bacterium]
MTCIGCENNVRFALSALPGVETVEADHHAKTVRVVYDPETTGVERLREALEEIGFEPAP